MTAPAMATPLAYRELRLCSNKGAYEALPQGKIRLDLSSLRSRLEAAGRAVVDARVMLILPGDPELTVSRDGRILLKTRDRERARTGFESLVPFLAGPGAAPTG